MDIPEHESKHQSYSNLLAERSALQHTQQSRKKRKSKGQQKHRPMPGIKSNADDFLSFLSASLPLQRQPETVNLKQPT